MSDVGSAGPAQIRCPRCNREVPLSAIGTSSDFACPLCGRTFEAVRFNPPPVPVAAVQMAVVHVDSAQPCATHQRNAAVASCQRCGAFMCALCRIDIDTRTLCPACFERLSSEGSLDSTRTTFRDFGGLASVTATAGCLLSILAPILGPLAIYYGVKGLRQKRATGETDGVIGIWVAMTLAAAEVVVGLAVIGLLFFNLGHK